MLTTAQQDNLARAAEILRGFRDEEEYQLLAASIDEILREHGDELIERSSAFDEAIAQADAAAMRLTGFKRK